MEDEAQLIQQLCEMARKLGKPVASLTVPEIMAAANISYHMARKIRILLELGVWKCAE